MRGISGVGGEEGIASGVRVAALSNRLFLKVRKNDEKNFEKVPLCPAGRHDGAVPCFLRQEGGGKRRIEKALHFPPPRPERTPCLCSLAEGLL